MVEVRAERASKPPVPFSIPGAQVAGRPSHLNHRDGVSVPSPRIEHMFEGAGVEVTRWQQALSTALSAPSGLDDSARIDQIRALEQLACTVSAAQAALSAELDASVRAHHEAVGEPSARQGRGVASQVAWARRESPFRGQRHLSLARVVAAELPHTWRAWRTGRITEWTATLIARETACLSREDRLAVDADVAGDPEAVEAMGVRQVVGACQAMAARLDPASVVERRRRAETDRTVTLRPAPDTMTRLSALLPVKDGVAVHAVLGRIADRARAAGDTRSRGQLMADTLVAAVGSYAGHGPDVDAPAAGLEIGLVMTDASLFGVSDEPAHLEGFGPVPAELARELVVDACSRDERVWLRRLYTSPTTGELVAMDSRARVFRGSLARFIRLRDQVCRTPWCNAPVRHGDHAEDAATGGATSAGNGQGTCEACNHAKQAPGWRASPVTDVDGHEIETTMPAGHRYRSHAPPIVRIHTMRPITIDYVLAG